MGLPLNDTVVEESSCSEGSKMVKGQCVPIKSVTNDIETETVTISVEPPVTELNEPKRTGGCPKGMIHGEHGICEPIESSTTDELTTEVTNELTTEVTDELTTEVTDGLTTEVTDGLTTEVIDGLTTEVTDELTTEVIDELTTEITDEVTTELNENVGGVENPKGCPDGTERDEQGYCQSIKPSNSTKLITDPKLLLKKDGSCPDNYKMIEGRCLYIKPQTNSTLYSGDSTGDEIISDIKPKSGSDESSKIELVPVLSDNSCPEGTVYSSYGLCQKRARPSSANLLMKPDGSCPDDFELIDGKCSKKNPKILVESGLSTTTGRTVESTTLVRKLFKSTTIVGESVYEPEAEATSSPLKI